MSFAKRSNRHQAGADWNSNNALLLILFKPIDFKTFPQCHPRAMKHHPQIALADRQGFADLPCGNPFHFSQQEHGCNPIWEFAQAGPHDGPELCTMGDDLGVNFPCCWRVVVNPNAIDELLGKFIGKKLHISKRRFASKLSEMINYLVF